MNSTATPMTGQTLVETVSIENPVGVSSALDYRIKKSAAPCRSIRSVLNSANKSTCTSSDTAQIFFPIRNKTYINQDSAYLSFDATPTQGGTGTVTLEHSAYTLLATVNIYHGNNLLESLQNYNVLAPALLDVSLSPDDVVAKGIDFGMSGFPYTTAAINAVPSYTFRKGRTLTNNTSYRFCLPLIGSAVLGTNAERYFPMALNDQLRLEVTFNSQVNSSVEGDVTWSFTNIRFNCRFLELGDVAQSIVDRVGSNYLIHGCSWRNTTVTTANTTGQQNFPFGGSYSSIKQILIAPLTQSQVAAGTLAYRNTARSYIYNSLQLYMAGSPIPSAPLTTPEDVYSELMASFDSADSQELNGMFDRDGYRAAATTYTLANGHLANHLAAINLDSYSHKSDVISSGTDSLGSGSSMALALSLSVGGVWPIHIFTLFDLVYVVDAQGNIVTKF